MLEERRVVRAPSVGLFTEVYHPIRNGVVASLDALAETLLARGCDVSFVTPRMPAYDAARDDVVRLPSLPLPTRTAYRLTLPFVGSRDRARVRRFAIVHAHSPFVTGMLAASIARRTRAPLVFTYHTQLEAYAHYVPFEPRAIRRAATFVTRRFADLADAVIVPTATMQRRLRELGVRAPIVVVPSGIDVAFFARASMPRVTFRARYGIAHDAPLALFVGRLGREKNVERVIDAFARVRDERARLMLIGDGPHRVHLERCAREAGVAARTIFAGEFARAALPDAYAAADAFAFASRSETQGLVLVEALAAGLPVVAVDTPQTRDVLAGAGELVVDRADALAAGLERALARQRDARGSLARDEAGRLVAAGFEASRLGARVLDLYRALLARPGEARLPEAGAAFASVN